MAVKGRGVYEMQLSFGYKRGGCLNMGKEKQLHSKEW